MPYIKGQKHFERLVTSTASYSCAGFPPHTSKYLCLPTGRLRFSSTLSAAAFTFPYAELTISAAPVTGSHSV